MNKMFRLLIRLIDVFLKILFDIASLFVLVVLKIVFTLWKQPFPRKNTICILKRYHDTIPHHKKSNHPDYLPILFARKPFKYSFVFCAGNGEKKITRFAKNVVAIDVYTPPLTSLQKIFPHLANSIRELVATIQSSIFIFTKSISVVEVDFPSSINIRAIFLKLITKAKIVTKVIGNIDLIFHQTKFPIFFPFQLKSRFGRALTQLYDNIISFIFFINCDLVIGGNKDNLDNALAKGAPPYKTYLARIKVDRGILKYPKISRENLELFPREGRVVLLWSRIAQEMMVDKATSSLIPLLKKYHDLHFVMIGKGSEEDLIKEMAKSNQLSSKIHLVGYRSRAYIKSAVENSDVVISPYGGSALVEAGLMKAAVVAFDYEWQSELIIDEKTGLLANFRSEEDIADKVEDLLLDRQKAKRLGDTLYDYTQSMFDSKLIDRSFENAYRTVV